MDTNRRSSARQDSEKNDQQRERRGSDLARRQNPKPPTHPARAPEEDREPADETQGIRHELEEMDNDRNI
jgi:hypothetical protein